MTEPSFKATVIVALVLCVVLLWMMYALADAAFDAGYRNGIAAGRLAQ